MVLDLIHLGSFTHQDDRKDANNISFGADMSHSRHLTNKTQSVLVLGHALIQKINDTTINAESLHYNRDNSYLFVNGKEVTKFKAKNSELIKYPTGLGDLSKDYKKNCRKDTGLYGNVYDFSVDYTAITNDKIVDIHNYLMKKSNVI